MTGVLRVLGIDYGRSRVGIAVSDPTGVIARGVTVLRRTRMLAAEVCALASELGAGTLVVGMPLTLGGRRGEIALEVEAFIGELRRECGLPVVAVDERFSSSRAEATRIELGVPKKKRRRKEDVDRMAAALILQDYLDGRAATPGAHRQA